MLYSVRMRAAQGGSHEQGGRHISGAERLVPAEEIARLTGVMIERAMLHSRGRADFINLTIEAMEAAAVKKVPLLPVRTVAESGVETSRLAARRALAGFGVNPVAAEAGFEQLLSLDDSMHGAMLICSQTGRRLDGRGQRGVRVSRMDITEEAAYNNWLRQNGLSGIHVREALVLAAKVAAATEVAAELCWSDDPEYTTGYVAAGTAYIRFSHLKPYGSPRGGRVFFVKPGSDLDRLCGYLEREAVLVTVPAEER
ncbi:6-carboxyhexanoate--coa ligase [Lucifera butyrica]|uniref:6-carboxyhexanoate--CoA ligase n=1 Tax=Lucifera butyrica TaxID=1351585 RepID=A0A498R8D1_9FIRM|nr:6-carboxyhexanoate--CoA ligase [Lucifera butyrica]VBB07449.1 6-carboxyhexanoate--coa ligase [Lucifera butyrica]